MAIPRTLATTGELRLRRREALRLTGRLFQIRRDINLVSNVLDVPKLFWSEASLKDLYDAVREYMEIGQRVGVLNEKLAVASDLVSLLVFSFTCAGKREDYECVLTDSYILYIKIAGSYTQPFERERNGAYHLDHHLVSCSARCSIF